MHTLYDTYSPIIAPTEKKKGWKDTTTPTTLTFELMQTFNFTLEQLRHILKNEKLRVSGTKQVIIRRIYAYLTIKQKIIQIQKRIRGMLIRTYCRFHGTTFLHRSACNTDCDFYTLTPFTEMSIHRFFSYEQGSSSISFGFDIVSLYFMIIHNKLACHFLNPFTREEIPKSVIYRLYRVLNHYLFRKNIIDHVKEVFQHIETITNLKCRPDWFTTLVPSELILFLTTLSTVWNHRLLLTSEEKKKFYDECGCNPFEDTKLIVRCKNNSILLIKILHIIECMTCAANKNNVANSYLILGALSCVSTKAYPHIPPWITNTFI